MVMDVLGAHAPLDPDSRLTGQLLSADLSTAVKKSGFGRHMWDVPISWVLNDENIRVSLCKVFTPDVPRDAC